MAKSIQSKVTEYGGQTFRSRLEAKWAAFFDGAGIGWDYEPRGFAVDGSRQYFPDFAIRDRLPVKCYVEVKPNDPQRVREIEKPVEFVRLYQRNLVVLTGCFLRGVQNPAFWVLYPTETGVAAVRSVWREWTGGIRLEALRGAANRCVLCAPTGAVTIPKNFLDEHYDGICPFGTRLYDLYEAGRDKFRTDDRPVKVTEEMW